MNWQCKPIKTFVLSAIAQRVRVQAREGGGEWGGGGRALIQQHGHICKQVGHEMLDGLHDIRRQDVVHHRAAPHEHRLWVRLQRLLQGAVWVLSCTNVYRSEKTFDCSEIIIHNRRAGMGESTGPGSVGCRNLP